MYRRKDVESVNIFHQLTKKQTIKNGYKSFPDAECARIWGTKYYGEWSSKYLMDAPERKRNSVGIVDRKPVENYCGNVYEQINTPIWHGTDFPGDQYKAMSVALYNTIQEAPRIPEPIVAYRLEDPRTANLLDTAWRQREAVMFRPYMSTSLLVDIVDRTGAAYGDRKALMQLYVPAGVAGIYVDAISKREECEVLLQKGQYLRVLRRRRGVAVKRRYVKETGKYVDVVKDIYECILLPNIT